MQSLKLILVVFVAISQPALGWRSFWKGRRFDGNVGDPTNFKPLLGAEGADDLWFNQKLDHFEPMNDKTWKQV